MYTITFKNEILNKKENEVFLGTDGRYWRILHKCNETTYTAYPLNFLSSLMFRLNWRKNE